MSSAYRLSSPQLLTEAFRCHLQCTLTCYVASIAVCVPCQIETNSNPKISSTGGIRTHHAQIANLTPLCIRLTVLTLLINVTGIPYSGIFHTIRFKIQRWLHSSRTKIYRTHYTALHENNEKWSAFLLASKNVENNVFLYNIQCVDEWSVKCTQHVKNKRLVFIFKFSKSVSKSVIWDLFLVQK